MGAESPAGGIDCAFCPKGGGNNEIFRSWIFCWACRRHSRILSTSRRADEQTVREKKSNRNRRNATQVKARSRKPNTLEGGVIYCGIDTFIYGAACVPLLSTAWYLTA